MTVRYAFPFVAVAAIFASLAASVITQDTSYIKISSSSATVKAGDVFYIQVDAVAHTAVNAIDITIEFPKEQLEVLGIDTGKSVISLWTQEPYVEGNKVHLSGGTFRKGFVGEHEIATIRAKATQTGSALVHVGNGQFIAGDGSGSEVSLTENDLQEAKIYVTNDDGSVVGTATVQIVTDINGDGQVTMSDIQSFMTAWESKSKVFDFNGDGRMSFRDFAILLADSFFK